jgi:hypothetical protein
VTGRHCEVGERAVWTHELAGGPGRPRRKVRTPGTVQAVDVPNLPPGVSLRFDVPDPATGATECYGTHDEIRPAR